jgi:ring-1,2-phenylacetyl-CoA epoxidase subunit PaaD
VQLVERPNDDFAVTDGADSWSSRPTSSALPEAAGERRRDASPASRARRSRRSTTTATTPPSGCFGSVTARSRTGGCRRPRRPWAVRRRAVRQPTSWSSRLGAEGWPSTSLAAPGWTYVDGVLAEADADPAGGRRTLPAAAVAACTPRRLRLPARRDAAPAPRPPAERPGDPVLTVDDAPPPAAAVLDPELPVLTIDDLGRAPRSRASTRRRPARSPITPTYSGCPRMDVIGATSRRACVRRFAAVGAHRPVAGLDHRLDDRRRPRACRSTASRRRPPAAADPSRCALSVRCPQCGSPRTRGDQPLRVHGVQVAVGVLRVPRAVRPLQGDLSDDRPHHRDGDGAVEPGRRHGTFHSLRVAAVEPLTRRRRGATRSPSPTSLRDGVLIRRPGSTSPCAPTSRRGGAAATTRSARRLTEAGCDRRKRLDRRRVLTARHLHAAGRATMVEVMTPDRPVQPATGPAHPGTTRRSPPAAASPGHLDRRHGARGGAASTVTLVYGNRTADR